MSGYACGQPGLHPGPAGQALGTRRACYTARPVSASRRQGGRAAAGRRSGSAVEQGDIEVWECEEGILATGLQAAAQARTGFDVTAPEPVSTTPPPTPKELHVLRTRIDLAGLLRRSAKAG